MEIKIFDNDDHRLYSEEETLGRYLEVLLDNSNEDITRYQIPSLLGSERVEIGFYALDQKRQDEFVSKISDTLSPQLNLMVKDGVIRNWRVFPTEMIDEPVFFIIFHLNK